MFDAFLLMLVLLSNVLIGMLFGYILCYNKLKEKFEFDEKVVYCHGFEDGIYYTIDEYNPELFRLEMAENSYREYKAVKYGPEKH